MSETSKILEKISDIFKENDLEGVVLVTKSKSSRCLGMSTFTTNIADVIAKMEIAKYNIITEMSKNATESSEAPTEK